MLLAQFLECLEKCEHLFAKFQNLIFEEELHVHEYLVIACPAGMDLLSYITNAACKKQLDL